MFLSKESAMRRVYSNVHIAMIAALVLLAVAFEAAAIPVAEPAALPGSQAGHELAIR